MPRWLLFALLTVLLWGGWGFLSRVMGDRLSAEHTLVVSTLATLPIIAVLAARRRAEGVSEIKGGTMAFLGGLCSGLGNLAFYQLLHAGERASTLVPLTSLYPLVTVLTAVVCLRERLRAIQVAGVVGALLAIYLFNAASDVAVMNRWMMLALLPLLAWGISAVFQKASTFTLSGDRATLWFLVGVLPVSVGVAWSAGWPGGLSSTVWMLALGLGALLGLGNLTLLAAYASQGKASVITPLSSLYPVVTVPLAIGLLGERVSARETLGIVLSLASVFALSIEPTPNEVSKSQNTYDQ